MLSVQKNVSLKKLNTLNFESTAEYFCSVSSKKELSEALTWAQEKNLPIIDRKSVVQGKSVDLGGSRIIKKKRYGKNDGDTAA